MEPLASQIRPQTLAEMYGQRHLIAPGAPLAEMAARKSLVSVILYGRPGIGKTTLALALTRDAGYEALAFNAGSDTKAQLVSLVNNAQTPKRALIVDEIHRMRKDIQDYLLKIVEDGTVTLIGITTVNPYFALTPALRSRALIFKLEELTKPELEAAARAISEKLGRPFSNDFIAKVISLSGGDMRMLINLIEATSKTVPEGELTLAALDKLGQRPGLATFKTGDEYYELLSAFHKSIRGSDVDAGLYYLAKLLATDDLLSVTRRLLAICYEDIGIANSNLGPKTVAACQAALELGLPEARLPLAAIVTELALSPKSNAAYKAYSAAEAALARGGEIPGHLKNVPDFGAGTEKYRYPHNYPGNWVDQQYLPDGLASERFFVPNPGAVSKQEQALNERYLWLAAQKKAHD